MGFLRCETNKTIPLPFSLQAGVAQQTLKVANRSFKSFFNLLKKVYKIIKKSLLSY